MINHWKATVGLIIALITLITIVVKLDNPWANALAIERNSQLIATTNQRLEQKIAIDNINNMQNRVWTLEDRYEGRSMPQSVKEELRKLQLQMEAEREKMKPVTSYGK